MIYIKLDKDIDIKYLVQKIENLIRKTSISKDSILEIKIKNISYNDHTAIPKLEYKP